MKRSFVLRADEAAACIEPHVLPCMRRGRSGRVRASPLWRIISIPLIGVREGWEASVGGSARGANRTGPTDDIRRVDVRRGHQICASTTCMRPPRVGGDIARRSCIGWRRPRAMCCGTPRRPSR
eukprot:2613754-Pleurochrysis_carterae.AAC.1